MLPDYSYRGKSLFKLAYSCIVDAERWDTVTPDDIAPLDGRSPTLYPHQIRRLRDSFASDEVAHRRTPICLQCADE